MKNQRQSAYILAFLAAFSFSCKKKSSASSSQGGSSFKGNLESLSLSSFSVMTGLSLSKTITHVMAVNPATGGGNRVVGEVDDSGKFSINVDTGKPYLLVFVAEDGALKGPDMIAATIKMEANDLDAFAIVSDTQVDLGDVAVDASTSLATVSTTVDSLLSSLGISEEEASYIGSMDDLALRSSNPDVDSNGVIDATENKNFDMDWHIRGDSKLSGNAMTMEDIENEFASAADFSISWTLGSGYAVYDKSYDDGDYVASSGVNTSLKNGGVFSSAGTAVNPTSMSGAPFSDKMQWGADYNMTTQELGASDAPAVFVYTLGSADKTLTFSNVRTKTLAQLNADGVLVPFVKILTSAEKFTGIGYKWMKRSDSAWVEATASEVGLLVQEDGGFLTLYTEKTGTTQNGVSISIPTSSASGTVMIGDAGVRLTGVTDPSALTLDDFCSSALSYDDMMGLRIFAGAPAPNASVTICN